MANEKRLIDANKLIDFMDVGHLRNQGELCYSEVDVANLLLRAPTVDAVEVVRCKYCTWYEDGKDYEPYCNHPTHGIPYPCDYDFCSYGERKEGAD